ncbi:hypothetical protein ACLMJK_005070 [Lecanora helva]
MPGLEEYLRRRKHDLQNSHRQEIQTNFKVPVPITKLEHSRSPSLSLRSRQNVATAESSAQADPPRQSRNQSEKGLNEQRDAFDTDAEGIDDTTVASSTYGDPHVQSATYASDQENLHKDNPNYEMHNDIKTAETLFESNSEGYSEIAEEYEESYNGDDGKEITEEVVTGLDVPEYLHFPPLVKDELHEKPNGFSATQDYGEKIDRVRSLKISKTSQQPPSRLKRHNMAPNMISQGRNQPRPKAAMQHASSSTSAEKLPAGQVSLNQDLSGPCQPQFLGNQHTKEQNRSTVKGEATPRTRDNHRRANPVYEDTAKSQQAYNHHTDDLQSIGSDESSSFSNRHDRQRTNGLLNDEKPTEDAKHQPEEVTPKRAQTAQKHGKDLDHSLDQLSGMNFQQLKDEPFHIDPQAPLPDFPPEVSSGVLPDKLQYLIKIEDPNQRYPQQAAFLKSLPMDEYEECGDFIVEKFSEMVKRFKDARKERRKAAMEFENEVAKREECVRGKIEAFEKDFERLKQSGEDVVRKRLAG